MLFHTSRALLIVELKEILWLDPGCSCGFSGRTRVQWDEPPWLLVLGVFLAICKIFLGSGTHGFGIFPAWLESLSGVNT